MTTITTTTTATTRRPAWVEIDLAAVSHNVGLLARLVAPARLCCVVKADGYGHGAVAVALAALRAGAACLAVALVEEGVALRDAGIDAPILLLSEPPADAMAEAVAARLTLALYTPDGVSAAASAAAGTAGSGTAGRNGTAAGRNGTAAGRNGTVVPVHLKADTGMHRVGAAPPDLPGLAAAVRGAVGLELEGCFTHLAVADDPDDGFNDLQLDRLEAACAALEAAGAPVRVRHAANTAAAIALPRARYDLVRCGIGCYGYAPSPACDGRLAGQLGADARLRPVLSLKARVHLVRDLAAGERTSYGRTYAMARDGQVAVLPLGYHDGVVRTLGAAGAEVLIGGVRRRLAGTVTMDQIVVDCSAGPPVAPGDEAVLIGRQGAEAVTADEWAGLAGTISYEILCGIGPRVPRVPTGVADATRR